MQHRYEALLSGDAPLHLPVVVTMPRQTSEVEEHGWEGAKQSKARSISHQLSRKHG
jgi:hypothetical protein